MQLPQLAVNCIIVSVVFPAIATIAIVLRFFARRQRGAAPGWSDWTIILALLFGYATATTAIFSSANGGLGVPEGQLSIEPIITKKLFQALIASLVVRTAALAFVKTSILLLYKQIFVSQTFQRTANVFLAITGAWCFTFIIGFLCVSTPLSVFWDSFHAITNYSLPVFTLTYLILDLFLDVTILCLPVPAILRLRVRRRQKYQLIGIFWLGIFCIIASICCIYYVWAESTVKNFTDPYYYWLIAQSSIWGNIEIDASIICACLPTYGPLVNRFGISRLTRPRTTISTTKPLTPTAQSTPPSILWKQSATASLPRGVSAKARGFLEPAAGNDSTAKGGKRGWVSIPGSGTRDRRLEREIDELDRLDGGVGMVEMNNTGQTQWGGKGSERNSGGIRVERSWEVESVLEGKSEERGQRKDGEESREVLVPAPPARAVVIGKRMRASLV